MIHIMLAILISNGSVKWFKFGLDPQAMCDEVTRRPGSVLLGLSVPTYAATEMRYPDGRIVRGIDRAELRQSRCRKIAEKKEITTVPEHWDLETWDPVPVLRGKPG